MTTQAQQANPLNFETNEEIHQLRSVITAAYNHASLQYGKNLNLFGKDSVLSKELYQEVQDAMALLDRFPTHKG